ncbi:M48 family metalloprotease [Actinoplanes sp. NPDC049681]|uniref:M48 family metalloprotease n=1 Tax=Actinoplanes sp. NPDC049681 TaxID=3363905 RepID=UPI0037AB7B57
MTASTALPSSACPRCAGSTVTTGLPRPWCPSCDWNLDQATPVLFGWRWVDRRLHRVAARLTDAQFAALAEGPLSPRTVTAARVTTLVAAAVLLAGVLAIAVLGVWLIFFDFFSLSTVLGAVLVGVAYLVRPRLGRMSDLAGKGIVLGPDRAPRLFALVERVATAVGAPLPQVLMIGYDLNAFTTAVGVRRTRVLCVGLPLWATLEPQERVALLGHELSHFVNGDVRRGPLTQVAETTLGRVAHLFGDDVPVGNGLVAYVTAVLTRALGRLVSGTARALQLLLVWTSLRDSQRAEYLADEMAARAAGTRAVVGLADYLVTRESIGTVIRREVRSGNGMSAWHAATRVARANLAANLPLLRRLTRQTEVSLYASHPPAGLRAEMLERRPGQAAAVTLTESEAAHIDDELAVHQKRVLRELAA